jgi:hypothetical protein
MIDRDNNLEDEMETTMSRECAICGSRISDDNPDGIGYTCRNVYEKAYSGAVYHFYGLEIWKEKAAHMADFFLETFSKTKFRSSFRKGFYESIKKQKVSGEYRISKKMYNVMSDALFGNEYGTNYPKITDKNIIDSFSNEERNIYQKYLCAFNNDLTPEKTEWIINLSKKYYNESK